MRFFAATLLSVIGSYVPVSSAVDGAGSGGGGAEQRDQEDLAGLRRREEMKSFARSLTHANSKGEHAEKNVVKALRLGLEKLREKQKRLKNSDYDDSSEEEEERHGCPLDLGTLVGGGNGDCPSQNYVCVHRGVLHGHDEEADKEDSWRSPSPSPPSYSGDDYLPGVCVPRSYWDDYGHDDDDGFFEGHEGHNGWRHHHHHHLYSNDDHQDAAAAAFVGYRSLPPDTDYHATTVVDVRSTAFDRHHRGGFEFDDDDEEETHRLRRRRRLQQYSCGDYSVTVGVSENPQLEFQTLIANCVTSSDPDPGCTNVPVTYWDTSNVTDMRKAFEFAQDFNEPLTCWNTARVTAMNEMFNRAFSFNQDVDFWDVSKVTNFEAMFKGTPSKIHSFNQCIGSWYGKILYEKSDVYDMFKHSSCPSTEEDVDLDVGPWCQTANEGCFTPQETCAVGTIFGGLDTNCASGVESVVSGGTENRASGDEATVSGGGGNTAEGLASTVSGGQQNRAIETHSTVSGGENNLAGAKAASVGGGTGNQAIGKYAAVLGGMSNSATKEGATISGGQANVASGNFATVGGGKNNRALGNKATVIGGTDNEASGINSVAMGYSARASKDNSVVIHLAGKDESTSTKKGQFLVRAKLFTLSIGQTKVDIDSKNIGILNDILNEGRRLRRSPALTEEDSVGIDDNEIAIVRSLKEQVAKLSESVVKEKEINAEQKETMAKQNEAIAKQNEAIESMRVAIEKQNKALESVRAMMESFVNVNVNNNREAN